MELARGCHLWPKARWWWNPQATRCTSHQCAMFNYPPPPGPARHQQRWGAVSQSSTLTFNGWVKPTRTLLDKSEFNKQAMHAVLLEVQGKGISSSRGSHNHHRRTLSHEKPAALAVITDMPPLTAVTMTCLRTRTQVWRIYKWCNIFHMTQGRCPAYGTTCLNVTTGNTG